MTTTDKKIKQQEKENESRRARVRKDAEQLLRDLKKDNTDFDNDSET